MDGKPLEQIDKEEAEYLAKINEEKQRKIEEAAQREKEQPVEKSNVAHVDEVPSAEPFSFEQWVRAEEPKPEKPQAPAAEAEETEQPQTKAPTPWWEKRQTQTKSDDDTTDLGLPSQQDEEDEKK